MAAPTLEANPRGRRLVTGITAGVAGRGVGALVPVAMIPVTLGYLGVERFGLWMAAASLTGMAAFADLGLGNGLMTRLGDCHARGDTATGRRYVASAYLGLTVVAAAGCAALFAGSGLVAWDALLGAGPGHAADARATVLVCLTAFLVNLPLSLVTRVQYATQQVAQSNLWQAAGAVAALLAVLGAVHARWHPLVVVAAAVSAPVLGNAGASVWVYRWRLPGLAPRPRHLDPAAARELLGLSGLFFALTVCTSIATNADALIVARAMGVAEVTGFTVPARVFALLALLVTVVCTPLWPASSEALARGDLDWVRRVTGRMTRVSAGLVLLAGAVLVPLGDRLLGAWLPGAWPGTDPVLLTGFALWWLLLAALSPRFMVQNAAGVLRPQLAGWVAYLLVSIPAKWYGARHLGLASVPYLGAATYLCTVLPAALAGYRLALRRPAAAAPGTVP